MYTDKQLNKIVEMTRNSMRALQPDCPRCQGKGWEFVPVSSVSDAYEKDECLECFGTGKVEKKEGI